MQHGGLDAGATLYIGILTINIGIMKTDKYMMTQEFVESARYPIFLMVPMPV